MKQSLLFSLPEQEQARITLQKCAFFITQQKAQRARGKLSLTSFKQQKLNKLDAWKKIGLGFA